MLFACFVTFGATVVAQTPEAAPAAARASITLDDLYSQYNVIDADISPSGKLIAAAVRGAKDDAIVVVDLSTGEKNLVTKFNKDAFGKQIDVHIGYVRWKTEDRLLFQVQSDANEDLDYNHLSRGSVFKLGNRLYAVDRNGKNIIPMFGEQWDEALVGAFDTSDIAALQERSHAHPRRVGGWTAAACSRWT
jgi:hypothetical protein